MLHNDDFLAQESVDVLLSIVYIIYIKYFCSCFIHFKSALRFVHYTMEGSQNNVLFAIITIPHVSSVLYNCLGLITVMLLL